MKAASPAQQVAGFIAKFEPPVAKLIRGARAKLRKQFPTAFELVYDNYNFLAIGFCTTDRVSDCFVGLAASSKGLLLSFYYGAELPDPGGLLQGRGAQHRFVRVDTVDTLDQPRVRALILAAAQSADKPLPKTGRGRLIVKSVSRKQRPRKRPGPN